MKQHKILSIDTSSKVLAMALASDDDVLLEMNCSDEFRHIETLFVLLKQALDKIKWTIDDIDIIVCGLGPGSFTGLRVGAAAVKGFASTGGKKIIGVSSLDVIAQNVSFDTECAVVVDARRSRIYTAFYSVLGNIYKKKSGDILLGYKELRSRIRTKQVKNKIALCGDALKLYGNELKKDFGEDILFLPEKMWYPGGRNIIKCARNKIDKGEYISLSDVLPRYLFSSNVQILKKQKKK